MTEQIGSEDIELTEVFDFLYSIPEEFFRPPTRFWQKRPWNRKAEVIDEKYDRLHIYGQQLAQKVSSASLWFVYKYFNFKKQALSMKYKQSLRAALQNISLSTLGIALLLWANNSWIIWAKVVIFLLVIFLIIVPYGVFVVWRNLQESHFYDRVERLLEIALKRVTEQNSYSQQ
jgi:hypothetical protein